MGFPGASLLGTWETSELNPPNQQKTDVGSIPSCFVQLRLA